MGLHQHSDLAETLARLGVPFLPLCAQFSSESGARLHPRYAVEPFRVYGAEVRDGSVGLLDIPGIYLFFFTSAGASEAQGPVACVVLSLTRIVCGAEQSPRFQL